MKRIAIIVCLLSIWCLALRAHTYVESSVLASGNIVKIQVPSTGVYRLTYEQIQAMGINPAQVRLLGYGGNLINQDFRQAREDDVPSVPFYMNKGTDNVFSAGDYILFYAKGPVDWKIKGSTYERTRNVYADYGCYFLSDNAGQQLLMNMTDSLAATTPIEVYTHTALQLHEQEQVNLIDLTGAAGGGRDWYGDLLAQSGTKTITFDFPDAIQGQPMLCRVYAAGMSAQLSSLSVKVGSTTKTCSFAATSQHVQANTGNAVFYTNVPSTSIPVKLSYSAQSSASQAYINYIEMHVPSTIHLRDNYLIVRNTDYIGQSTLSRYHLLGADATTQVWNITQPSQAYICHTTWVGDTLCWLGENTQPQVFLAVRTSSTTYPTPATRGKILNQNLHQRLRGVQHVIVAPDHLLEPAEQLKQAHELYTTSERWAVVSDEEVFNEFSSGTPDASAIRWMMKYLWDNFGGTAEAPRTVLLFGDGSYDNRQILTTSGTPTLLTYQSINSVSEPLAYATDDYFGWLLDNSGIVGSNWNESKATMQIGVGRLPVTTYEQAEQVVNKIATYLTNVSPGSWKQQLCFLADDGDAPDQGGIHVKSVELAATAVAELAPEYIINKIYLDSYAQESSASGERYPAAQATYNNLLQSGVMLMDYAGHGSANNICSEMFLTRKQVEDMTNTNLGVWALATCSFAHFDQRDLSTAEAAVLNPNGGAIGVISSSRTAYVSQNEKLNKHLCANLFTRQPDGSYPYTLGEALRLAKNKMVGDNNKLCYVLLGDPSVKLNYPTPYQLIVTQMPDTLHATDLVTIKGYVADHNLDSVHFDGEITINVFDKQETMVTRDNDQPIVSQKHTVTYLDYPYLLFVGQALVHDTFTIQFRMPKDLRYNIDYARLTLYATGEDANGYAEALGHSEDFKVGGSSPFIIYDDKGPDMQLYLNSFSFKEGETVNATPHFYANLYDENGINTAGSGIGHDLLLTVDNDAKQAYVLNKYFTSASGSYQAGVVSYPMSELADGQHTLTFRACDMLNNATTMSLGFNVSHDAETSLKELLVYPNPISRNGELSMYLSHDRPDDIVSITLTFYDLAGHTIWSTTRRLFGVDAQAYLSFNLAEANLASGAYIYQFRLQTTTAQSSQPYSGKIVVY